MIRISATSIRPFLSRRPILVVMAALLFLAAPMTVVQRALADRWDDQMSALQSQADQYQSQADQLRSQGDTLQNRLNEITAQVNALQAQININQQKKDQLQSQIADNEAKLNKTQNALGDILANLYIDGEVSSVELLASAQSITDFVDKQEYRNSAKDQLNTMISDIQTIKSKLESDKKKVEAVLADLDRQNQQMVAMQRDQQQLVDQTRGEEAAYQNLVNNARSEMAAVSAQQQAYYASLGGGGGSGVVGSFQYWGWSGNQGCAGGYPYCQGQDTVVDPWNLYNRECVSYVAWAIANRFHRNVAAFHGDGNAYQWPSSAPVWSGAFRVPSPQPGDAVILPASSGFAPIGHAMLVESVSGDDILVSQYNMYGTGQYSTMHIRSSGVIFLRFPQ